MNRYYDVSAQKKPLNLTINADLVSQARAMTGNLSAKVEELLADYVTNERDSHSARALELQRAASEWKAFTETYGSFADEFSTL
ncbi:type II toxin-antitoxin system CcdA family antitoxin [Xanthomonas arboricola]|uniref:Plasmid maintenance protein CcdB n=1 Tax=Xanthomonas arboricola pv. guizotiae TaxID=487867 RepID=A0A2S7A7V0_9XANT|nr:type II toxin-antitoxin system CcdA family antitoxin [Xanthomonas arboricola]PPU04609.1 plasmid maintenance protein CcdB [Xanthomonas arboricola pv. guizotiae]PPU27629.1 plasmid maintenance protein CcdB [Xanthomonas arboricola pv. guizotiae]